MPISEAEEIRAATLLEAAEEMAEKLGVRVLRDQMSTIGGLCRMKGEWRLYLNDELDSEGQLIVCAQALAKFDLSDQYVLPALRQEIERFKQE